MRIAVLLVVALATAGCSLFEDGRDGSEVDVTAARQFDEFPLYWVGEEFGEWELTHVELPGPAEFATFIYGTCTPSNGEQPSCTPPLEIQVFPLCAHLADVAAAPIWKRRNVRGAPVGTIDSAPVLFTAGAQVKVYRGEGSDPGAPLRALHSLRSLNSVPPVIAASGPIPAPPRGVLEGTQRCRASASESP